MIHWISHAGGTLEQLEDVLVQNVLVSLWSIIQLCLYIALTLDYNPFHHHFIISPYPLFPFCPPSLPQSSHSCPSL